MMNFSKVLPVNLENDDVVTLVSIVPFLISEFKPGIYPGRFVIPPCINTAVPCILEVGPSVHFIQQFSGGEEEMTPIVVKDIAKDIAAAILSDYFNAQMDVDGDCRPGLTAVNGRVRPEEFVVKYKAKHLKLISDQNAWFGKLVRRADNDWNRYKNHLVVSDNQRFAARALGLEKEWLTPLATEIPIKCPSCMQNCDPRAVVCSFCRCILKPEEYKKLNFAA